MGQTASCSQQRRLFEWIRCKSMEWTIKNLTARETYHVSCSNNELCVASQQFRSTFSMLSTNQHAVSNIRFSTSCRWIDPMVFLAFIQNHKSNGCFDGNINQIFACVESLPCCKSYLSVDRSLCPSLLDTIRLPEDMFKYLCFRNRITWPSLLQCSRECSN